jgi:hypothetical protein
MVQRVERRLRGIADFLEYGGKLLMVQSVLASLSISFMTCLDIPISFNNQVIKYMRHCLWRKKNNDVETTSPTLVSCEKISDQHLYQIFRHLVSYAKNTNLTVHSAISLEYLKDLFHLPLSQEAFLEFEELEVICGNTMLMIQEGNIVNLSYIWGKCKWHIQKGIQSAN